MRESGKSIITFTIILSPIFIMGRPIVGRIEDDYYSILGVNENSSPEDVLQAFYALSERYNPDTTNEPNALLKLQKIKEAYEILSDVDKRRQYDYLRRLGGSYQQPTNFAYPNVFAGDSFGRLFGTGTGGNAYAWVPGNQGGASNYGWGNGWGTGNGFNSNYGWGAGNGMNNGYAWGQGGGNNAWGTGSGGNGGAWVVGGGENGAAAWAAGGSGSSTATGGKGAAAAVSGGGNGEVSYESYTINGCTTVTQRNGNSVTQYTTCE